MSWPSLLLVLVVFGFAPGFCLRLIVLAYPRNDPRRAELIPELYAVPRIQRPLWVAEKLEVALFEGFAHRASVPLRQRSVLKSVLGSVTTTAGVMVIALAGVGVVAQSAHPGDELFPLIKILDGNYARSVEAAEMVENELDQAEMALEKGDTSQARKSLQRVQEHLTVIAGEQGHVRLATEHHKLEEILQGTPGPTEPAWVPEPGKWWLEPAP